MLQPQERRRDDRQFTAVPVHISQGQTVLPVMITDITSQGCRLELQGRLQEGAVVSLDLPGGPRHRNSYLEQARLCRLRVQSTSPP